MVALPSSRIHLLDLPLETRINIYMKLFTDAALAVKEETRKTFVWKTRHNWLLTCKSIRREALPCLYSATTLLVYYGSGFVDPDWTEIETTWPEPAEWKRYHVRDWTGFPSLIPSTYLSAIERAVIHSNRSCLFSFILNLDGLPKLKYLEIRSLGLEFDGLAEGLSDFNILVSNADDVLIKLVRSGLFRPNAYLDQLEKFYSPTERCLKARVMFPVTWDRLHTVYAGIDVDDIRFFRRDHQKDPQALRPAITLDRLRNEKLREEVRVMAILTRKRSTSPEEESPEIEG